MEGIVKCVLFKSELTTLNNLLHAEEIVFIKGRISFRDTEPSIRVSEIIIPKEVNKIIENTSPKNAIIRLEYSQINDELLFRLKEILLSNKGTCPVFIEFKLPGEKFAKIKTSEKYSVSLNEKVHNEIRNLIGEGCLIPKMG